jgi:hypothetical protein
MKKRRIHLLGDTTRRKGCQRTEIRGSPLFSLDKRIKGLEVRAIKTSTEKAELNNSVLQEHQNLFIF